MMPEICMEIYKDYHIPDEDMLTALKVIRTIRDVCLFPNSFDSDGAVILSHAHAKIVDLWKNCDGISYEDL